MDKSSRQVLSSTLWAFGCLLSADRPFLNQHQRCPMTSPEHKECFHISKVMFLLAYLVALALSEADVACLEMAPCCVLLSFTLYEYYCKKTSQK